MSEKLTNARARYLALIRELDPEDCGVRSIDLANTLQISRPSVHAMIAKLEDMGFVTKEYYGLIHLTEKGRAYTIS